MQLPDAGDVAQLVRGCRCGAGSLNVGCIYTVCNIIVTSVCQCGQCGFWVESNLAEVCEPLNGIPQMWLRRIPPLPELEKTEASVKELLLLIGYEHAL